MKKHRVFTLLETAIVMFIVALMAAAGLSLATAVGANQGVSSGIGNES